jgi:hypothetical protein
MTKGYREEYLDKSSRTTKVRTMKPGMINTISSDDFHRVTLHKGRCWTLFLSTDRLSDSDGNDWGFYDPEGDSFVPWGEYHLYKEQKAKLLTDQEIQGFIDIALDDLQHVQ